MIPDVPERVRVAIALAELEYTRSVNFIEQVVAASGVAERTFRLPSGGGGVYVCLDKSRKQRFFRGAPSYDLYRVTQDGPAWRRRRNVAVRHQGPASPIGAQFVADLHWLLPPLVLEWQDRLQAQVDAGPAQADALARAAYVTGQLTSGRRPGASTPASDGPPAR